MQGGGGYGVGSVPDAGPDHRSWENLGRGLNTILKVGAGPKHMFKLGFAGGSIHGIISSVCGGGGCYGTLKTPSKAHGSPSPPKASQ